MVFCFSDIEFDEIVEGYGAMLSPNDIILLSREIAGLVDMPAELNGDSDIIKNIAQYSKLRDIIVVVAMRAKIGDRIFNSAMVVDKGHILGVSDEIYPCADFAQGKVMRSYLTTMGKMCIFIDSDICFPQLWQGAMQGCRYIFNLTSTTMDSKRITCARTLACSSGKYVLCKFTDGGVCVNAYGKIESIKWGRMSAFYLPMSFAFGKNLRGKITFVEEKGD